MTLARRSSSAANAFGLAFVANVLLAAWPVVCRAIEDPAAGMIVDAQNEERAGRWPEAERLYARAAELREKALGPTAPLVADALVRYAVLRWKNYDYQLWDIGPVLERAQSIDPSSISGAAAVLLPAALDRRGEAIKAARALCASAAAEHGEDSLEYARALDLAARFLRGSGEARPEDLVELARRALQVKSRLLGEQHADTAWSHMTFGQALFTAVRC